MTDRPTPSAEAVEAHARICYEQSTAKLIARMPSAQDFLRPWDVMAQGDPDDVVMVHEYREQSLAWLTGAYPQIVADVLNHYADALDDRLRAEVDTGAPAKMIPGYASEFMRSYAAEVLA